MKVALINSRSITICSRKLKQITTIYERSIRVKSACFDEERDVLLYTTSSHLKYCNLRTGETGTIRSTENTIYLVRASGNKVWYLSLIHISEPTRLLSISYAVFCLKKKKKNYNNCQF
eukprot:TRINITY_DN6844_c0_g1_i2.p2 TRINITY_DN6844_c0_g1~~TRINITY_DN6844_c0_g1_i2.p2  ORF type:complete len:118 (-),score=48.19 TRINITY_DN6844_c0_g1_i2:46-399(-)